MMEIFFYAWLCTELCHEGRSYIRVLKVVTSEKRGGSGVISTPGTWYGGVVMGVLFSFNEAVILYRDFNSAPSQKQNIIVFAANNSRCWRMSCSTDYYLVTCSQRRLVCADVCVSTY
jgi:hypothetical protein